MSFWRSFVGVLIFLFDNFLTYYKWQLFERLFQYNFDLIHFFMVILYITKYIGRGRYIKTCVTIKNQIE